MNCAEFQRALPHVIDGGGSAAEEAHLNDCGVCTDLVQDLKYIAGQAKLLVPMHDPSPRVWHGIQSSLEREGLVAGGKAGRFQPAVMVPASRWGMATRLGAFAALLLMAFWLISYRNAAPSGETAVGQNPAPPAVMADASMAAEDRLLLAAVSKHSPERAASYKASLRDVNTYIHDAKRTLEQDPRDVSAREHLLQAYEQRAMLYEIATARTMD